MASAEHARLHPGRFGRRSERRRPYRGRSQPVKTDTLAPIAMREDLAVSAAADAVNSALQDELRRRGLGEIGSVEAARYLEAAGILADSASRPGLPLRRMLRAGQIAGAEQRPAALYGRWYIKAVAGLRPGGSDSRTATRARDQTSRARNDEGASVAARRRRDRAARKYRPDHIKLLLLAEAPPSALNRYFYFEHVPSQDSLFRYVTRVLLGVEPTRSTKRDLLAQLQLEGVFLIDLKQDPVDARPLVSEIPYLVRRIHRLNPDKIIVIKTSVFDLVKDPLLDAGFPLVDERVPFPGSGQQKRFVAAFERAVKRPPAT